VLALAMGLVLSLLLQGTLARWDWEDTATMAKREVELGDLEGLFTAAPSPEAHEHWRAEIARRFASLPGVVRVKVWDREGTILWSDEPRLIGQRFPDNAELREALAGRLTVETTEPTKAEHVYEEGRFGTLAEVYVPIRAKDGGAVIGVLELYKTPTRLVATLKWGLIAIWSVALCGGLVLALVLLPLLRRVSDLSSARPPG
jgi:hypothetical protein